MPVIVAAVPAGAFHTPRLVSVAAQTPATAPLGPIVRVPARPRRTRFG